MYVLTMDQRGSREAADLVPDMVDRLNTVRDGGLEVAFDRTVGDEIQGVTSSAEHAVELVLFALREPSWWIGVGVGAVEYPLPADSRSARGPAFVNARRAVDSAKAIRTGVPVVVATDESDAAGPPRASTDGFAASDAEVVLRLVGHLVTSRSDAQWRILDALVADGDTRGSRKNVARRLDISPQAVSKSLATAGWEDEKTGRIAAAKLLAAVHAGA